MTGKVKTATEAMEIARDTASQAGLFFYIVSGARKEGDKWKVEVVAQGAAFEATIAATSGEVTEWKLIATSSKK